MPATEAVASSCVELSAVPYVIGVGVAQVIVGVVLAAVEACTLPGDVMETPQPLTSNPPASDRSAALQRTRAGSFRVALH